MFRRSYRTAASDNRWGTDAPENEKEAHHHDGTVHDAQNKADDHIHWGLGFGIPDMEPDVLWHWGDNSGFKSFAVWDKATREGVVINTNSDNGMDFYMDVLKELTDGKFFDHIADFIRGAE